MSRASCSQPLVLCRVSVPRMICAKPFGVSLLTPLAGKMCWRARVLTRAAWAGAWGSLANSRTAAACSAWNFLLVRASRNFSGRAPSSPSITAARRAPTTSLSVLYSPSFSAFRAAASTACPFTCSDRCVCTSTGSWPKLYFFTLFAASPRMSLANATITALLDARGLQMSRIWIRSAAGRWVQVWSFFSLRRAPASNSSPSPRATWAKILAAWSRSSSAALLKSGVVASKRPFNWPCSNSLMFRGRTSGCCQDCCRAFRMSTTDTVVFAPPSFTSGAKLLATCFCVAASRSA
mmetsp:Transcript_47719/g.126215  ORF Transcript_47719/g.126215 Transcript_47719/m.126215 type:complete len:293 (+) Transcript_47719:2299-3177(+)